MMDPELYFEGAVVLHRAAKEGRRYRGRHRTTGLVTKRIQFVVVLDGGCCLYRICGAAREVNRRNFRD